MHIYRITHKIVNISIFYLFQMIHGTPRINLTND
jgi:hypothetical protein